MSECHRWTLFIIAVWDCPVDVSSVYIMTMRAMEDKSGIWCMVTHDDYLLTHLIETLETHSVYTAHIPHIQSCILDLKIKPKMHIAS